MCCLISCLFNLLLIKCSTIFFIIYTWKRFQYMYLYIYIFMYTCLYKYVYYISVCVFFMCVHILNMYAGLGLDK